MQIIRRLCANRLLIGISTSVICAGASAQCVPEWRAYAPPYLDAPIFALTTCDRPDLSGTRQVIIAGGNFSGAGSTWTGQSAMWDGDAWHRLGEGVVGTTFAATVYQVANGGAQPVIGGVFTHSGQTVVNRIARFDGEDLQPFQQGVTIPGSNFNATVYSLTAHNGDLVAGGIFNQAGSVPANGIARWDGQQWHSFPVEPTSWPFAMSSQGGHLYIGGWFQVPGGSGTFDRTGILRWNGSAWEALGHNFPRDDVEAFATFDGQLHVGGWFYNAPNNPPEPGEHVARFDGTTWHPLGSGTNGIVEAMAVFDPDGTGEKLFIGGGFTIAGGIPASRVAMWDGTQWHALGDGVSGRVRAMTVWRNQLVVGGHFYTAGGITSPGMALWGCELPPDPCLADCDGSGTLNIDDFLCFINAFAGQEPYADCDENQVFNIDDFLCFINAFAQGCP